jgi:lysophospholipase L1-like esterase
MKSNEFILNGILVVVSTLASLLILEIGLRAYHATTDRSRPVTVELQPKNPKHIIVDTPVIYALNPMYPGISSQGLRDDEILIPKPEGSFRVMVLGDSVTYGLGVSRDRTFGDQLEKRLQNRIGSAEVINAGVNGYTAYNELQYYLTEGRKFGSDLVIVAFCMNDIVNPRLHWNYTQNKIVDIPDAAIPNAEYDRNVILPRVQGRKSILQHSELFNTLERLVSSQKKKNNVPTYITGEDSLSIEVLLDENSPEWQWLTSIYDTLHAAVQAEKATLVIAIFPLAYQMDRGYPFLPQKNIMKYCQQNDIHCIDLLPSFKNYAKDDMFLLNRSQYLDIWHLTEFGHKVSANEIFHFLRDENLIRSLN